MSRSNFLKRAIVVASIAGSGVACLAGTAAAPPAIPAARTIKVLSASVKGASSPSDRIWKKAPRTEILLQPAFPGHVSIVGTPATQRMTAQAVRSGGSLYVRLAWDDSTSNTSIDDTNKFLDAAAVQFPIDGKGDTLAFMGDPQHAVNVWQWRADGQALNIVAKGFGTATRIPTEALHGSAVRTAQGWNVVLVRPLQVRDDEGVNLRGRRSIPVAFAAWDGGNEERDGFKAVTLEWWELRF